MLTYILYSYLSNATINNLTIFSVYILLIKSGNIVYGYFTKDNYNFFDSFQKDCLINFNLIFNDDKKNKNFNESLTYLLDNIQYHLNYLCH